MNLPCVQMKTFLEIFVDFDVFYNNFLDVRQSNFTILCTIYPNVFVCSGWNDDDFWISACTHFAFFKVMNSLVKTWNYHELLEKIVNRFHIKYKISSSNLSLWKPNFILLILFFWRIILWKPNFSIIV